MVMWKTIKKLIKWAEAHPVTTYVIAGIITLVITVFFSGDDPRTETHQNDYIVSLQAQLEQAHVTIQEQEALIEDATAVKDVTDKDAQG